MQTVKRYISRDGRPFDDRFACARHELTETPGLLNKLAEAMCGRHISEQRRWCGGDPEAGYGGSACGCMGCANHAFYALDLQYEHWKVWIDDLRGEQPSDKIPSAYDDVDLILDAVGHNRVEVYRIVRAITGLGLLEAKHLIGTPGATIKCGASFRDGQLIVNALTNAGATVRMEVAQ